VDIMRVFLPLYAKRVAKLEEVVVFPTLKKVI